MEWAQHLDIVAGSVVVGFFFGFILCACFKVGGSGCAECERRDGMVDQSHATAGGDIVGGNKTEAP